MQKRFVMMAVAAMLFAGQGYAQDKEMTGPDGKTCDMPGMHEKGEGHGEQLAKELGLTDEQAAKMKAHFEKMKGNRPDFRAMREKHEKLRAMMDDYGATKEQMTALSNEMADEQKKHMQERIDATVELKSILTPEQFAKFQAQKKAKHEEMRKKFRDGKGNAMGEGHGGMDPDMDGEGKK